MRIVIISASSDIGLHLAKQWLDDGHEVIGTYRTKNDSIDNLLVSGMKAFYCLLEDNGSIEQCCNEITEIGQWDCLVLCPGTMVPIGKFEEVDFLSWSRSVNINFIAQMSIVKKLLPSKQLDRPSTVIFFAGGGTNSAPLNYSAYTVSKIALIKMCELLDAESTDCKFSIIGPGWVKTKIHNETIDAGDFAGQALQSTLRQYEDGTWTSFENIQKCCEWIMHSKKEIVGGRNFSVVHDSWGEKSLENHLLENSNYYKLRRAGNDIL